MPGNSLEPRDRPQLFLHCPFLLVSEVVRKLAHTVNLTAFNQEEPKGSPIVAFDVRADLMERTPREPCPVRHEKAVIAEAVGKAAFPMPLVNSGEHLERMHMRKLPGIDRGAVKHRFPNRVALFSLINHGFPI